MRPMGTEDGYRALAEPWAAGALEPSERAEFEAHLESGCPECREAAKASATALAATLAPVSVAPSLRQEVLDLSDAPRMPVDLTAYTWDEPLPGLRMHTMKEDAARGVRACLVWAKPGVVNGTHRHVGTENILMLQGGLKDERAEYHEGDICRSRTGSIHHEEVLPGEDCICYVVYYGPLEYL